MNFVSVVCLVGIFASVWCLPSTGSSRQVDQTAGVKVNVASHDADKEYKLNLVKPKGSVLAPNLQVVNVFVDDKTGHLVHEYWTPTKKDLHSASHDIHIDTPNLAAVKISSDNEGNQVFHGVVDGMALLTDNYGTPRLEQRKPSFKSDYITLDPEITLEPAGMLHSAAENDNNTALIAEIAVVCDMELGRWFDYNREKILEYWTVYFWDLNMRFKTLPNVDISLRVTSITVIQTPAGQPFIEESRNEDGIASYNRILPRFGEYMYSQMESLPKFDMAMMATDAKLEWYGGLAYLSTACKMNHVQKRHVGVMVYSDWGGYTQTATAAHELAHVLGAPHDSEFPGGCDYQGYIMGGNWASQQWFFSPCSDRAIGAYAYSSAGACLAQVDETGNLPVDPEFSSVETPTMTEQCIRIKAIYPAVVREEDTQFCINTPCWIEEEPGKYTLLYMTPLQNSPCLGGGRCFRGRCLPLSSLLVNVGSGRCVRATNGFTHDDQPEMVDCAEFPTPLDKFTLLNLNETVEKGVYFGMPFFIPAEDTVENADKCLWAGGPNNVVAFGRCESEDAEKYGWDLVDVGGGSSDGSGEFLMKHRLTGKCAKQGNERIYSDSSCNSNDKTQLWKLQN